MAKKILTVLITGIGCLVLMIIVILFSDRKAPKITISSVRPIDVTCELDIKQALEGVSAIDNKDGDLTEAIFIEEQSEDLIIQSGKITYVAVDEAKNVAKLTRTVTTNDRKNKRTIVSSLPDNIAMGKEIDLSDYISMFDGCGKEVEGEFIYPTIDTSVPQVIDLVISDANKVAQDIEVSVQVIDYESPTITLTTDKIKIYNTEEIDYLDYIKNVSDNKNSKKELIDTVTVKGYINFDLKGSYKVTYTIKDSDGNTASADLIIEVEITDTKTDETKDDKGNEA